MSAVRTPDSPSAPRIVAGIDRSGTDADGPGTETIDLDRPRTGVDA